MQLRILLFFQSLASPFLDLIMNMITVAGEMMIPVLVILIIYWCVDKKKGLVTAMSLLTALMTTQIIKAIVRYPRPFMMYPDLIKGGRISTATGYSFPSGHSTTASSFYGSIAMLFRSRAVRIISILLIIAVPLSRLYLGVHWPMDVIGGTAIGLASAMFLVPVFCTVYDNEKAFLRLTMIYGSIMLIVSLVTAILLDRGADERAFADLSANGAVAAGVLIGAFLERKHIRFSTEGTMGVKVLRLILGLVVTGAVTALIMVLPLPGFTGHFVAFSAAGFSITFLYPAIAVRLRLMQRI